jgi:DNA polymerase sigma
VNQNNFVI